MDENPCFQCPYCMAENFVMADPSGGPRQTFINDCEVCCRPMLIHLFIDDDGEVEIQVEQDS